MELITLISAWIVSVVKFPFIAIGKILVTLLNLVPLSVYELHGVHGYGREKNPDLRETKQVVQGANRVHLGSFLVAWVRGVVIKKENIAQEQIWGVWTEEYQDIKKKWVL